MSDMVIGYPNLMKKWAHVENEKNGWYPDKKKIHTRDEVFWKCVEKNHLYKRQIELEQRGLSCPDCRNEKKTFVSDVPELIAKWAFYENKNEGKSPNKISIHSTKEVHWRCIEKHHLYPRTVTKEYDRKYRCPECRKEDKLFVTGQPNLMKKWAHEENKEIGIYPNEVTVNSNKLVYWRCSEKHHIYPCSINQESIRKSECPKCKEENQKYLSDYPELLKEFAYDLNDVMPEELTKGSDVKVKWRCEKSGHVRETSTYNRTKYHSECPFCTNRKILPGFPEYIKYWDFEKNLEKGIEPANHTARSKQIASWICDKGHHFEKSIKNITTTKSLPCPECEEILDEEIARKKILKNEQKEERELQTLQKKIKILENKRLLKEENKIEEFKKITQQETIFNREIKIKELNKIYNEMLNNENKEKEEKVLEENRAFLAKIKPLNPFWDNSENEKKGFTFEGMSFDRMYSWMCDKGHKWKSDLPNMTVNKKCPECYNEENSISKIYPYLIKIYDIKKNGNIPPNKNLAVPTRFYWWTCIKGHSFVAQLSGVAKHKETGCLYCDKEKSYYSL